MSSELNKKPRMEWLDAMRGFTMILVVCYHVALYSFGQIPKQSTSLSFLVLFRMPLFFFVSGFLAYKANFMWTVSNTLKLAWKKLQIQVIPAVVFLCAYLVLRYPHFWDSLCGAMASPTKYGYWFTWVLLQMFIIYYVVCFLTQKFSERWRNISILLLWVLSLGLYELCYLPKVCQPGKNDVLLYSSFYQTMLFLPYFLTGNLARRYWTRLESLFDSSWFFPTTCLTAFICCADIFRWHTLKFGWTNLPRTIAIYSLLTIVVIFFRHCKTWFTKETKVGSTLQYIGTRTLDIYLLHFIFLPVLKEWGGWFNTHQPNFLVDFLASLVVAVPVIAICLLVSNILRVSPFFSERLFGRKGK